PKARGTSACIACGSVRGRSWLKRWANRRSRQTRRIINRSRVSPTDFASARAPTTASSRVLSLRTPRGGCWLFSGTRRNCSIRQKTGTAASFAHSPTPHVGHPSRRPAPARFVTDLAHESLWRVDRRKEERIAHRVQGRAQNTEPLGRSRVKRCQSMLFGQTMVCRELKTPAAHFLEVLQVRPTPTPATVLDVIGKDAAKPERVVSEVRTHQEAATCVGIIQVIA